MSLRNKLCASGTKKLLALEGGGIRGVLALEYLIEIERVLREQAGGREVRLCDYFDYIAGTSTGAIIAAGLSLGLSAGDLLDFYARNGKQMFDKASLLRRLHARFEDDNLAGKLKEVYGEARTLGDPGLQTLLLVVLRNATTDSPWPVSNNPCARYNDRDRRDCNLALPLWQIVRASTAAPTYFPPETVTIGPNEFVFVDGGVTVYNNPAFLVFLMATMEAYWPNRDRIDRIAWPAPTGADRLLVVSVGTGTMPNPNAGLLPDDMNIFYNVTRIPSALMFAASTEQDMLCRVFGDCRAGEPLDREIGDLRGSAGPVEPKLFTYLRYSTELSRENLDRLGAGHLEVDHVRKLDGVEHLDAMRAVGRAAAARQVAAAHFAGFPVANAAEA
ncbi:MAG TPA: patatin-like phospholipase family protein [Candidatus Krumholzibacteria bacterium]|nr:patatin-like phospholipase family protein [Candidatus Krumholzibacteria bacterium]HPD73251.1 patatin-like phospholipase family protein [Candidatus Krumholzibacteria bacterium]HRY40213.1 patatin-like phospholipase family protein [Candidatus Krumholzibacteria bacterium]